MGMPGAVGSGLPSGMSARSGAEVERLEVRFDKASEVLSMCLTLVGQIEQRVEPMPENAAPMVQTPAGLSAMAMRIRSQAQELHGRLDRLLAAL